MKLTGEKRIAIVCGVEAGKAYLSTNPEGSWINLWYEDDGSGRQVWKFDPVDNYYHILISKGVDGNKKYLSKKGKNGVDLWHEDDGSGRQRWKVEALSNGLYTIRNIEDNSYLSTYENGEAVNLWHEDDGSGRQRWLALPEDMKTWMNTIHDDIKDRKIKEICIPGSHDAGVGGAISYYTKCVVEANTRTQLYSFYQQLLRGIRYFDLRPKIRGGQLYAGHYSDELEFIKEANRRNYIPLDKKIDDLPSEANIAKDRMKEIGREIFPNKKVISPYQGADGNSLSEIVNDINEYKANYKSSREVIILSFDRFFNYDEERGFNEKEFKELFTAINDIKKLWEVDNDATNVDLSSEFSIQELTQNGPCIICIFNLQKDEIPVTYQNKFFIKNNMKMDGEYSNMLDFNNMAQDQLEKLRQHDGKTTMFALSWTRTLDEIGQGYYSIVAMKENIEKGEIDVNPYKKDFIINDMQTALDALKIFKPYSCQSILTAAEDPRNWMMNKIYSVVSKSNFPNIIETDGVINTNPADLAFAINKKA